MIVHHDSALHPHDICMIHDPLLVSKGAVDRSEPNLSPATDISTILEMDCLSQGQPIAGLSHRDQTISENEKFYRNNSRF